MSMGILKACRKQRILQQSLESPATGRDTRAFKGFWEVAFLNRIQTSSGQTKGTR